MEWSRIIQNSIGSNW